MDWNSAELLDWPVLPLPTPLLPVVSEKVPCFSLRYIRFRAYMHASYHTVLPPCGAIGSKGTLQGTLIRACLLCQWGPLQGTFIHAASSEREKGSSHVRVLSRSSMSTKPRVYFLLHVTERFYYTRLQLPSTTPYVHFRNIERRGRLDVLSGSFCLSLLAMATIKTKIIG